MRRLVGQIAKDLIVWYFTNSIGPITGPAYRIGYSHPVARAKHWIRVGETTRVANSSRIRAMRRQ